MIFAAIDVGSNAIRLKVARVKNGKIKTISNKRTAIRLGKDVFNNGGAISQKKIDAVAKAFKEYKKIANQYEVDVIEATATSATREASNQKEFKKEIEIASGIELNIITPLKEAKLIHLAVSTTLDLKNKNAVLMDIGGGSVELIASEDNKVKDITSFKMGTLRSIPAKRSANLEKKDFIYSFYAPFAHFIFKNFEHIDFIVGTGGNLECLGNLRVECFEKRNPCHIRKREIDSLTKDMLAMNSAERAEEFDLSSDRADVILPAILTSKLLMRVSNIDDLQIPHVGLRDGLILDLAQRYQND